MDLTRYSGPQTIYAAQDDKFSRDVEIILLSDGLPWMIPEDVSVQIRYSKSDGTGGEYSELSEGTPAWSVTDNLLTIILAPEVLDVSGSGSLSVVMTQGQAQLSTFFMGLSVDAAVDSDEPASDGSGKKRKYLPAPDSAEAGQYLRVLSVDEDGYVTEVEAVPAENTVGIHNEDSEAHPDLRLQLNDCVRTSEQELTEEAKAWARENIGAISASDVETMMKDYEPAETMEIIPSGNTGVWINNYGSYKTEVANFYLHEPIRITKNMQTLHMKNVVVNTTVAKLVYSNTPTLVDGVSYKRVMLPGDSFATVDYDEQIDTSYEYLFIAQNTNSNGNIQSGAQYFITGTAEDIKEVAVRHTAQTLTDDQKAQARSNIGAVSEEDVVYIMGNREVLEAVEVFPTGSTGVWINSNGAYKTEVANFYLHYPIKLNEKMRMIHMENIVVNTSVAKLVYSHTPTIESGISYPRVTLSGADGTFDFELDTSYEYLFISENTTTGGRIVEGAKYFITQEAETNKPLEVHLAPRYDIVQGDTLELFYAGILNVPNPENYFTDISCDVGKVYRKRYMFTPGSDHAGKSYTLTLTARDDRGSQIGSAYTTIRVVSKNASQTTANVLCVGDSLTAEGTWVKEFRNRLDADGFSNVKLIGSQTSGSAKHEGHAGWSYASYLASSAENPFWNTGTSSLDFANYMTTLGLSGQTIDYCIILLGWNESNRSETEFIANVNRFCAALRTAYPNCKILFVGLQIPSQDGLGDNYGCAWNWRQKCNFVHNLDKWYQEVVSSLSNSTSVQLCGQFDTENNMPTGECQVNRRNPKTETYGTNGIHPNEYGYLQIADAVYRGFIGF